MKKVINGLDKGTTAWFDDNDNPTLVHIEQEIVGKCESVLLFGWEIDVIHKHTRADLAHDPDAVSRLVENMIKMLPILDYQRKQMTTEERDAYDSLKAALEAVHGLFPGNEVAEPHQGREGRTGRYINQ
jgi:hypothetical protein